MSSEISFFFCFWANIHNFMSIQCLANILRPMNGMSSELIKWKYKIVETLKEYICKKPWFSQLSWYLVLGIEGKKRIWYLLKAGFDYSQLIKIICYKKSRILKIKFVIIWFGLVFDKMLISGNDIVTPRGSIQESSFHEFELRI